jgi:hypothetical protein
MPKDFIAYSSKACENKAWEKTMLEKNKAREKGEQDADGYGGGSGDDGLGRHGR